MTGRLTPPAVRLFMYRRVGPVGLYLGNAGLGPRHDACQVRRLHRHLPAVLRTARLRHGLTGEDRADSNIFTSRYPDDRYLDWLFARAAHATRCAFAMAPDLLGDAAAHLATLARAHGLDRHLPPLLGRLADLTPPSTSEARHAQP